MGVDYKYEKLDGYIYKKLDVFNNVIDDDNNCVEDDFIGWDFVFEDDISNNLMDDYSYGMYVVGIIVQIFDQVCIEGCCFYIILYKIYDV